jgi:hypothetical protein
MQTLDWKKPGVSSVRKWAGSKRREEMNIDDIDYDTLMADEWDSLTEEKILVLRNELADWKENREKGGYDIRLIKGAIAVCDAWLAQKYPS